MTDYPEKKSVDYGIDTVVIDFDGTIAESRWPSNEIGKPIETGVEAIIHYHGLGNEVIIYTSRPPSHSGLIWRWLTDHGLNSVIHDVVCGKPRGWVYIDDRAWQPPWVRPHVVFTEAPEEELVTMVEATNLGDITDDAHLPPVIGLAGHMGAGKDTIGNILVQRWGYERLGFADALKALALYANPFIRLGSSRNETLIRLSTEVRGWGWEATKRLPEVRRFLQELGAGARHLLGEDAWIMVVLNQMEADHRYVITDVRYPNEAETIEAEGGETWVVRRPGYDGDGHVSEALPETWFFDDEIDNDGSIEDLDVKVERALLHLAEPTEEFVKMSATSP